MSVTAPPKPILDVSRTGTEVKYSTTVPFGDDTYRVTLTFPLPYSSRTCLDGAAGMARPHTRVVDTKTGKVVNWAVGGRASLPQEVNEFVAETFKFSVGREHAQAHLEGFLPVPESVLARFRTTDPEATVDEVREAQRASKAMVRDLGMGSDRTALWIARNFVTSDTHRAALNETVELESEIGDLKDDIGVLEEKIKELEKTPASAAETRAVALLDALAQLRSNGRAVLEYQVGENDLDKIIDFMDSAAGWTR